MKLIHVPKAPQNEPRLRKAVLGAYLLVDDITHSAISKAADAIEKRTAIKRSTMARASILTGYGVMFMQEWKDPTMTAWLVTAMFPIFYKMYNTFIEEAEKKLSESGVNSIEEGFAKSLRLPMLIGAVAIKSSLFAGIGICCYLLSSSNGLLDRVAESVSAYFAKPSEQ